MLKLKVMRRYWFAYVAISFGGSFVYYAFSYNAASFGGSLHVNMFVQGLAETMILGVVLMVVNRWPRKRLSMVFGFSAAVLIYGMIPFTFGNQVIALTVMTFLAKFCAIGFMRIVGLMKAEIFPTTVRQLTLGTISVASRIGSVTVPYTKDLVN